MALETSSQSGSHAYRRREPLGCQHRHRCFGNIYVVDENNYYIQKFDSSGKFLTKWGSHGTGEEPWQVVGIAVDDSGNVYATDWRHRCVQKFDNSGNFLAKWGSYGSDDGKFVAPTGIAVDASGNVYVYDGSRIQKFDSSGKFLTKWKSEGLVDGKFLQCSSAAGIAIDAANNIYVASKDQCCIQKFDTSGKFTAWGLRDSRDGEFLRPFDITVDARHCLCSR